MKLFSSLCTLCMALLVFQNNSDAQTAVRIVSAERDSNFISLQITSDAPFRIGDNRYYLHIGDQKFSKYKQHNTETGGGTITFFLTHREFEILQENSIIWLCYGNLLPDAASEEEIKLASAQKSSFIFYLENFSKSLISKN